MGGFFCVLELGSLQLDEKNTAFYSVVDTLSLYCSQSIF